MERTISIIMPVYNEEKHLHRCLDSILAQRIADWELLAVNDASTDASLDILRAYGARDARIRVLQSREKGIIPALRVAVEAASGTFITRMDADDYMPVDKLERLRAPLLKAGPGHLSTAQVEYFSDEFELGPGYRRYAKWLNTVIEEQRHWEEIYRECTIPSPAWMCLRSDFMRAGAHEPNDNPEDYDLAFRFYQSGLKTIGIPEILHFWRDHTLRSSRNLASHANQQYFRIKLPWFLKIDHAPERPLVLWGAGPKGKELAKMLLERNIPFHWCCDTPSKWGQHIYGVLMGPPAALEQLDEPQIIIAVSNPDDQRVIQEYLHSLALRPGKHIFWFC